MQIVRVEEIAMSTRVALPMFLGCRMSEVRREERLSPSPTNNQLGQERSAQVCRNLFGPIDHDENAKFVQDELSNISQADCKRWNFDFQSDRPKEGRYAWERVAGAEGVPQAYELPTLSYHQLTTTPHTTTTTTTTTIATPIPQRSGKVVVVVPEGGGDGDDSGGGGGIGSNSGTCSASSTSPVTSDDPSPSTSTHTTTATTSRIPTTVSTSSSTAADTTSTKNEGGVIKTFNSGDKAKMDSSKPHKPLPTVRHTRTRSSQPPLTDFFHPCRKSKSKRASTTKLDTEEQPPALKRPKTTSS